jgi:subtilisin family serine protease
MTMTAVAMAFATPATMTAVAMAFATPAMTAVATAFATPAMTAVATAFATPAMTAVASPVEVALTVEAVSVATESAVSVTKSVLAVESTVLVEPTVPPMEVVVNVAEVLKASPVAVCRANPIAVPVELRMPEVEMIPGASADKHSVDEPFGPVIAIGHTGKRVVRIVAVGAHRRGIIESVVRTDLDTNGNLGVRRY